MTPRLRKRLIRSLLLFPLALILLVLIAVAILYSQQQRLVNLAIKELNKQLQGELAIGSSNIAAFENFPYVSIRLNQVKFYGSKQTTLAPICEADKLFVGFSLPDILKQKYHVKVIALKDGNIRLVQDMAGKLNIVEASKLKADTAAVTDTTSTALDLNLKKVVLKNIVVSYLDQQSKQQLTTNITKIKSAFKADSANMAIQLEGNMVIDYLHEGDSTLFRNKQLTTELDLNYNTIEKLVTVSKGKLQLEQAIFNIAGTADLLHGNEADLKITGDKPDFRQLFSFAPASVQQELKHFNYNGRLSFDGIVKGKLTEGQLPLIQVNFSCADAWLHNTEADKKLDSLAFKGYYTNGTAHSLKTSELHLLNMNARPGKGLFKGSFIMRDFTDPKILMKVQSDLQLEFIGAFLGIKDLQHLTGNVRLNMDFKEIVDISVPEESIAKLTQGIQSELTVTNLTFRMPGHPYRIDNLNLHAAMKDGFVKLDSMVFRMGGSDLRLNGSISDLPALFHAQQKPVTLTLNAGSRKLILKELLAYDTARSNRAKEEINDFNIGLSLQTSVAQLLHPTPLPKGVCKIAGLRAAFKHYPHAFKDFGAELTINDTALLLRNFAGNIDSSDLRFNGRVNNYALWFDKVKKGRTQIAFDIKSSRLAMRDLLGRKSRQLVPPEYHDEIANNLWIRSKTDLKYDSVFRFANIKIANISGELTKHPFKLDSISGNVKLGADHFVKIDTLKGKIGKSDFDISMRLYTGKDTVKRKKENYLQFNAKFLDVDQIVNYRFTTPDPTAPGLADIPAGGTAPAIAKTASVSSHAKAFNIFQIPFIDFKATVNIGKIKYNRLWIKNLSTNVRMQADQHLYLDTFNMEIAEGQIAARAVFNGSNPDKIYLKSRIKVNDVNIEKLLLKLDYLGQDYVINKNIKGRLTGQIRTYVQVHPDLTPLLDHSEAELDVNIRDGVLINFTPMQAMSSYFKDKNLNMVRFDTLHNKLTFKNGALSIPAMNINSSIGFLEISGTQALDMKMEYYIRVPLKMVTQVGWRMLFGKKQEEVDPDQVDAIEYRDKDKRVRFLNLKISGTPDDYKINLGKVKKA